MGVRVGDGAVGSPVPPGQSGAEPVPPHPGGSDDAPRCVTANGASLLGFAGAVWYGFCGLLIGGVLVWSTLDKGWRHPWGGPDAPESVWPSVLLAVVTVVQVALMVLLIVGGVLLQRRRRGGRRAIMAACGIGLALAIGWEAVDIAGAGTAGLVNMATLPVPFLVALLVLVLAPPTKRWCEPQRG